MKKIAIGSLLTSILAMTAGVLSAGGEQGWTTIAPGVESRSILTTGQYVQVHALRTTAGRIRIAARGGKQLEAEAWRASEKALAAINGGYYNDARKPLGLRISRGRIISPLHGKMWGVFTIQNGRARIVPTEKFKPSRDTTEAVQCGPRLVEGGVVKKLKPQWARRSGIGVTREGKVVLAVADGSLSLTDWAKLWADKNGLSCTDALNLDGGPSSQLALRCKTKTLRVDSGRAVSDAVLISAR